MTRTRLIELLRGYKYAVQATVSPTGAERADVAEDPVLAVGERVDGGVVRLTLNCRMHWLAVVASGQNACGNTAMTPNAVCN